MTPFCNLFRERPSYIQSLVSCFLTYSVYIGGDEKGREGTGEKGHGRKLAGA